MRAPLTIYAPPLLAYVRGEGGTIDSALAFEALVRLAGDRPLKVVDQRPADLEWVSGGAALRAAGPGQVTEALLALVSRPQPLPGAERRGVFCPPSEGAPNVEWAGHLFRALGAGDLPVLCLPDHPRTLEGWGAIGPTTLFSPRAPYLHARALACASFVVTFRRLPALVAAGLGLPVLWLSDDVGDRALGGDLGIEMHSPTCPAETLTQWVLSPRPNEKGRAAAEAGESQLRSLVGERSTASAPAQSLTVASISSGDYLPFLEGYCANVIEAHPGTRVTFYVLALDGGVEAPLRRRFGGMCELKCLSLEELWGPERMPELKRRSLGVRAFSSKPLLIARAVEETHGTVFYADSDVHFLQSSLSFLQAHAELGAVLFPHWNDVFSGARRDGVFNAGMVVATPKGLPFLRWWGERCWENANFGKGDGVVADQGYLDFGPAYFPQVQVYRRGDHNVARWNLSSVRARWSDGYPSIPCLGDGEPVKTYHAAFIDDLGISEIKVAWDALNYFFSPEFRREPVPRPLMDLLLRQQAVHWLSLSRWLALADRLGWKGGLSHAWAQWGVGPLGTKITSLLAGSRRVVWSSRNPVFTPPEDAWVKANQSVLFGQPESESRPRLKCPA